jgi:hypothetical protein
MRAKALFAVLLINLIKSYALNDSAIQIGGDARVLSRQKRFVIFPTGSSFSVAVCMTVGIYGNPAYSLIR